MKKFLNIVFAVMLVFSFVQIATNYAGAQIGEIEGGAEPDPGIVYPAEEDVSLGPTSPCGPEKDKKGNVTGCGGHCNKFKGQACTCSDLDKDINKYDCKCASGGKECTTSTTVDPAVVDPIEY